MKRDPSLVPLSHDHQHGLFAAHTLKRAGEADAAEARAAFLEFWTTEGREHFRVEEEVLLPSIADVIAPTHEAVVRVLTDHVALRRMGDEVAAESGGLEALHRLGDALEQHIRHEERVLFPMIEQALDADRLAALGAALR